MAFARTETGILNHPKFLGLDPAALGLWTLGNAYCWDQLTDGFIPAKQVRRLLSWIPNRRVKCLTSYLTSVRLWDVVEGGYQVHDWLDHNPPASRIRADRESAKVRADKSRRARLGPDGAPARASERTPHVPTNVRRDVQRTYTAGAHVDVDVDVRSKNKNNSPTPLVDLVQSEPFGDDPLQSAIDRAAAKVLARATAPQNAEQTQDQPPADQTGHLHDDHDDLPF